MIVLAQNQCYRDQRFEQINYQLEILRIAWTEHMSNNEILEKTEKIIAEISRVH